MWGKGLTGAFFRHIAYVPTMVFSILKNYKLDSTSGLPSNPSMIRVCCLCFNKENPIIEQWKRGKFGLLGYLDNDPVLVLRGQGTWFSVVLEGAENVPGI